MVQQVRVNDRYLPDQAAEAKARKLLEKALTLEQRRDLFTRNCFPVQGRRFMYRTMWPQQDHAASAILCLSTLPGRR